MDTHSVSTLITGNLIVVKFNWTVELPSKRITIAIPGFLSDRLYTDSFSLFVAFAHLFFPFILYIGIIIFGMTVAQRSLSNLRFLARLWILHTMLLFQCFCHQQTQSNLGSLFIFSFILFWLTVCMFSAPIDSLGSSAHYKEEKMTTIPKNVNKKVRWLIPAQCAHTTHWFTHNLQCFNNVCTVEYAYAFWYNISIITTE